MNFSEGYRLAINTIKGHKLRSFLTALGIIIGVMAVIGMMSIIGALEAYMRDTLSVLGGSSFTVQKYPAVQMGRLDDKYHNRQDITFEQLERLRRYDFEAIDKMSPVEIARSGRMSYRDETTKPNIQTWCADRSWLEVQNRHIKEGRYFTDYDLEQRRNVMVMGVDIVEELFPYLDPIGKEVKAMGKRFQVIGILDEQGQDFGQSQDNLVAIPATTFKKTFGKNRNISIMIKAKSPEMVPQAMEEAIRSLRVIRKVPPGEENDFEIATQDTVMNTLKDLTGFVFIAAVIICGISLVVGGIGIMNIMLVSVTERTREIGVRKAIGARKADILNQFLTEAVILCLAGGLLGVLAGAGIGALVSAFLHMPPVIPLWSIILGLGFSLIIGVVFGVYPAMKAAKLDPIVALRYE
ncbi:MAG: ABC transporter permease [Candidatus Marinimicrobia bacterium]|nr:ABC transporter permease [Candidatus Neomarinimicrobiota bacterium]